MSDDEIDRGRVEVLAAEMMAAIKANYERGPHSRDRIFEALNALAFCAATVIVGTGDRDGRRATRRFLDDAVSRSVNDLARNPP